MQEQKTEKSFAKKLCEKLDIPSGALLNGHSVEIRGREEMRISGSAKILLYAPCEIRVALSDSLLAVVGRDLLCVAYSQNELNIQGKIESVTFKEGQS
jgi:sporulation protein YqfC